MKPVHARRLLKLADFLDELPDERFNLDKWIGDDWKGKQDLSCGTTACALGWACTIPEFKRLGARLEKRTPGFSGPRLIRHRNSGANEVAMHLFGIGDPGDEKSYRDFFRLFFPSAYPKGARTRPWQVAARIRLFVDERRSTHDKETSK